MRSVMKHQFSQVPQANIPRSSFDRSHGVKTTFDADYLIPFFADEVLPGDTFKLNTYGFARLSTPIDPVMDNLHLDTFYFFVPLRLLWTNFVKMMGEQDNPGDSTDYTVPVVDGPASPGYTEGSLYDYLGIPPGFQNVDIAAWWTRAYNLVWNQWFRDENLQNSVQVDLDDGPDTYSDYVLLKRGKRHDYFTSCLPWPQKGTAVDVPIGTEAPILGIGKVNQNFPTASQAVYESNGTNPTYTDAARVDASVANEQFYVESNGGSTGAYPNIRADLSSAAAATINQLRQAFQIQKMYERDARGGTRYIEHVHIHFGVISPDARLQRSEFLGGGTTPIMIQPIYSTNEDTGTDPLGTLGGIGTAAVEGHGFTKSFTEHGVILGLVNVRGDITYQQGVNRMFHRQDRLDFYWPSLAHIGEQAVLNKEIYQQAGGNTANDAVFGYQERYAEYRYKPSTIHGAFRSSAATPLDSWHLSEEFSSLPTLGSTFIQSNTPVDRVIATPTEPHIIADFYHKLICARPMPLYGVPGNIDRF